MVIEERWQAQERTREGVMMEGIMVMVVIVMTGLLRLAPVEECDAMAIIEGVSNDRRADDNGGNGAKVATSY